jgi:hypothetical protein
MYFELYIIYVLFKVLEKNNKVNDNDFIKNIYHTMVHLSNHSSSLSLCSIDNFG